jgi:hypothetical protein
MAAGAAASWKRSTPCPLACVQFGAVAVTGQSSGGDPTTTSAIATTTTPAITTTTTPATATTTTPAIATTTTPATNAPRTVAVVHHRGALDLCLVLLVAQPPVRRLAQRHATGGLHHTRFARRFEQQLRQRVARLVGSHVRRCRPIGSSPARSASSRLPIRRDPRRPQTALTLTLAVTPLRIPDAPRLTLGDIHVTRRPERLAHDCRSSVRLPTDLVTSIRGPDGRPPTAPSMCRGREVRARTRSGHRTLRRARRSRRR